MLLMHGDPAKLTDRSSVSRNETDLPVSARVAIESADHRTLRPLPRKTPALVRLCPDAEAIESLPESGASPP